MKHTSYANLLKHFLFVLTKLSFDRSIFMRPPSVSLQRNSGSLCCWNICPPVHSGGFLLVFFSWTNATTLGVRLGRYTLYRLTSRQLSIWFGFVLLAFWNRWPPQLRSKVTTFTLSSACFYSWINCLEIWWVSYIFCQNYMTCMKKLIVILFYNMYVMQYNLHKNNIITSKQPQA